MIHHLIYKSESMEELSVNSVACLIEMFCPCFAFEFIQNSVRPNINTRKD
jgi:hypothetical protein